MLWLVLLQLCFLLQQWYAFLIPESFSKFLCGLKGITTSGTIEFEGSATNTKGAINPGAAYSKMGEEWLSEHRVQKVISNGKHKKTVKYCKALCTALSNGGIPTDGEHLSHKAVCHS